MLLTRCIRNSIRWRRALHAVFAAAATVVTTPAFATDYHWAAANGTWDFGSVWSPDGEPGSGDRAILDFNSSATIHVRTPRPAVAEVDVTNADVLDLEHENFQDGYVDDLGDFNLGDPSPGPGSGTLNVFAKPPLFSSGAGHLAVGGNFNNDFLSTVNQSGGTVSVTNQLQSVGTYNFSGGILSATNLKNYGTFNQSGGTVSIGLTFANVEQGLYSLSAGTLSAYEADINGNELYVSGGEADFTNLVQQFNGNVLQVNGTIHISSGLFSSSLNACQLAGGTLTTPYIGLSSGADFRYSAGTLKCGTISLTGKSQVHLISGAPPLHVADLDVGTLSGGTLDGGIDLSTDALVDDQQGAVFVLANLVRNGAYDGVHETSTGIVSSTAIANSTPAHPMGVGYGSGDALGITSFDGVPVGPDSALARYAYLGDANLDGVVNALDFNALASNYGALGEFWFQGDFSGDGIVNTLDFTALAHNFGESLPAPVLATLVPEPDTLAAIGTLLVLRRRNRAPARSRTS